MSIGCHDDVGVSFIADVSKLTGRDGRFRFLLWIVPFRNCLFRLLSKRSHRQNGTSVNRPWADVVTRWMQ